MATRSKKHKLDEGKDETPSLLSLFGTSSSPMPSLEMMAFSPPTTRSKGKAKVGKSVWEDPTIALGRAHNVITNDELKDLSSIPSHKLVSRYIHKLVQVLGKSLCLTMDYLNSEEKVAVANSKVDSIKAESSKLRKDLIKAMDQSTRAKEKVKELKEVLKVEKKLVIQKDEEIQAAFLKKDEEHEKVIAKFVDSDRFYDIQFEQYFKGFELFLQWMMKHHSHVTDFPSLNFEAIDNEILADKANEKEGETIAKATDAVRGDSDVAKGGTNEVHTDVGHVEEIFSAP
nr:hypothetical protein CFP56_19693 [Quercus suber]